MSPSGVFSKSLEERISSLISQLSATNEGLITLGKISEKHDSLLYGRDAQGGLVSSNVVNHQTLEEHSAILDRLEKSCNSVASFMEAQVEVNKAQQRTNANVSRSILIMASCVFLILLLIGVADISALRSLLSGISLPH